MSGIRQSGLAAAAGFVMLASVATGATAAATPAGKCSEAVLKWFNCGTEFVFFGKVGQKFCKGGAEEAAKFGEKLAKDVNKCNDKFNNTMEKLDCATTGDPNAIADGDYDENTFVLTAADAASFLQESHTENCNGLLDPP